MFTGAEGFSLDATLGCGQAFRWKKRGDYWEGVFGGDFYRISQCGSALSWEGTGSADALRKYLGLDDDYARITAEVGKDEHMRRAAEFSKGLRILRQDPWECLFSYMLSANNSMKNIALYVERLCEKYGKPISFGSTNYFAFPEPMDMAHLDAKHFASLGFGFRAPRIKKMVEWSASGNLDVRALASLPYRDAKEMLLCIDGVADKIADCVLAFSMGKGEAFPIDRWIRRFMTAHYFGGKKTPDKRIRDFAMGYFGSNAAYAQEFIYFYAWKNPPAL